jgi:GTP-binding protein Era
MSDKEDIAGVAGTVAILGRPNVGKSTLLNRIVGEKLAIVSPKPQTTRNRIAGVWNGTIALRAGAAPVKGQIVFVDTPGVHAPRSELSRFMVREALDAVEGVDAVLLLIEAPEGPAPARGLPREASALPETERRIIDRIKEARLPAVLAVNKVDRLRDKSLLLPVIEAWSQREPFKAIVPISATEGVGVVDLVRELLGLLPEGPPLHDEETVTDRSERFLAGELIREQLFLRLRNELPYATAVVVENWEERGQGDVVIDATILVERESQKGIVVGKGGQMIRDVGQASRVEISKLLGRPAHLRLHAKVAPDWTTSPESIARLGYEREDD